MDTDEFLSLLAAKVTRISVRRSLAVRPNFCWKWRAIVARDMWHSRASSGRDQGRSGSLNKAANAGAKREWLASASNPAGVSGDSLAIRHISANMAVDSAFSMTRPPRLSKAESLRIRFTRPASCKSVPGRAVEALRPDALTTRIGAT